MQNDHKTRKIFGLIIKRLRIEAGLSQGELAEICDLDRTYISLLERGHRSPKLETILILCSGLKIPAPQLFEILVRTHPN